MSKKKQTKKQSPAQKAWIAAVNEARDAREVNSSLIHKVRNNPTEAEKLKALMEQDLREVFEVAHPVFGNSCGRDRYRQIGKYPETLVRLVYGTHSEFQRAAELTETLTQRTGANRAGRLAAAQRVASYAKENLEPFAGQFDTELRDKDGITSLVVASDFHSSRCDPFARRVWLDILKWTQPTYCIYNGDVAEFSDFSTHRHLPGHFDLSVGEEIEYCRDQILGAAVKATPESQHIMTIGNHEYRMVKYLADRASALAGLPSLEFVPLFGLDKLGVGLVCRSNFLAPTAKMRKRDVNENWVIIRDRFVVTHGQFLGNNADAQHAKRFQMSGTNGHSHNPSVSYFNSIGTGPLSWCTSPMMAGHAVGRDYVQMPSQWQMGFNYVTIGKSGHVQQHMVLVTDEAHFAGRTWKITAAERKARQEAWVV